MPLPSSLASFNRVVTNRITRPFAGRLPGFAVVTHVGRVSGATYRTPVNMFRRDDDYVFVLTYGPEADWVRNVQAAGECDVESRGRPIHLVEPRRVTDPTRSRVPAAVAGVLRLIDVDEFMLMRAAGRARAVRTA